MTTEELLAKWSAAGESLSSTELAFMAANNIEPRFNDYSWRDVLEAYRAGYEDGRQA